MSRSDYSHLERIASQHDTHADFDGVIAQYTGLLLQGQIKGGRVLEAGCSTGVMTPILLGCADQLEVVEGSSHYAEIVRKKFSGRLLVHVAMFEDFKPAVPFDTVVAGNVLHHIADPLSMMRTFGSWLQPGGNLHLTVPNMTSFHRQLGVAMGAVKAVDDESERNRLFHQPGRFTREKLEQLVQDAGMELIRIEGFFFKPFPHDLMNRLSLPQPLLQGLFEMGRRYPDLACQIHVHARLPNRS